MHITNFEQTIYALQGDTVIVTVMHWHGGTQKVKVVRSSRGRFNPPKHKFNVNY